MTKNTVNEEARHSKVLTPHAKTLQVFDELSCILDALREQMVDGKPPGKAHRAVRNAWNQLGALAHCMGPDFVEAVESRHYVDPEFVRREMEWVDEELYEDDDKVGQS